MILDTDKNCVYFHKLGDLEDLSARKNMIFSFEEDWMPHLKGDQWSWASLEEEADEISKYSNKNGRFDEIIKIMRELKPQQGMSPKEKRKYYEEYSFKLANAVDKLLTPDVRKCYPYLDLPFQARSVYLGWKNVKIKGIDCFLPPEK